MMERRAPEGRPPGRLPALDWMRGLVMILMTIDHASGALNAGRLITDGALMYKPGAALPADQFLTRWMTHLCAPSFVFLAGAALALSVEKQLAAGGDARKIDGFILRRGLLIASLDLVWMSWAFLKPGLFLLQVLYAIGMGLVCMIALRRLPTRWLLGVGLGLVAGSEALAGLVVRASGGKPGLLAGLLLTGGRFEWGFVAYPLVPWLAMMVLGWSFGRWLRGGPERPERLLAVGGAGALAVFGIVRGLNAYGNWALHREGGSVVQWLHVSKYPPSISYTALELGIGALCLAALFVVQRRPGGAPVWTAPLLVLGQTALFFYVLHVHLLKLAATLLGLDHRGGLRETYLGALGAIVVLYPLCVLYRRYKQAHPLGWTRYL